jgi:hypothetical protein
MCFHFSEQKYKWSRKTAVCRLVFVVFICVFTPPVPYCGACYSTTWGLFRQKLVSVVSVACLMNGICSSQLQNTGSVHIKYFYCMFSGLRLRNAKLKVYVPKQTRRPWTLNKKVSPGSWRDIFAVLNFNYWTLDSQHKRRYAGTM